MDKIDQEFMDEMAKGQTGPEKSNVDIKIVDDGTTLEDIQVLQSTPGKYLFLTKSC